MSDYTFKPVFPGLPNTDEDQSIAKMIDEVKKTYGHSVSVQNSDYGPVTMYGRNEATITTQLGSMLGTIVPQLSGTAALENYPNFKEYLSDNLITTITSNNNADVGAEILIKCATIDGNKLTLVDREVTLNGTSPVTMTGVARSYFFKNIGSQAIQGVIHITEAGATYNGSNNIEDTEENLKLLHLCNLNVDSVSKQRSVNAEFPVPDNHYFFMVECSASSGRASGTNLDVYLQTSEQGNPFQNIAQFTAGQASAGSLKYPIIIPPNTDIRMSITSSSTDSDAIGHFRGFLAKIL